MKHLLFSGTEESAKAILKEFVKLKDSMAAFENVVGTRIDNDIERNKFLKAIGSGFGEIYTVVVLIELTFPHLSLNHER
ncbi:hypothetical protein [Glaciecola sp. MF2-115]|uniref:hypothetical protein n=1 Tax=Glaciecola sp. MF2-115 TaxID=3384827 RepID=UPI0039A2CB20